MSVQYKHYKGCSAQQFEKDSSHILQSKETRVATEYSIRTKLTTLPIRIIIIIYSLFFCISSNLAQTQQQLVNKDEKKDIVETITQLLEDNYVYPDLGEQYGEEFIAMFESGEFDTITDAKEFGESVTTALRKIMNDKHIRFRLIEASDLGENKEGSLHHPVRLSRLGQTEHLGFLRLDWIEDEVGYLDFRRFNSPTEAKEMLLCAIKFLSSANAIIIDLRKNQGGSGDMVPLLSSYFLEHPTQLSGTYYRQDDITLEIWTLEKVEGERLLDVPLFLVIGKNTFSAAESFAYDMKVRKRATLVGDSTKGGAHSVDLFKIGDQFEIYISTARAVNPVTDSNWERIGVIPDVLVPGESALDTAIILAKKAAQEYRKLKDAKLMEFVQEMQTQLDDADSLYRIGNDKLAESLLDAAFQTGSKANLLGEFFIQVLAYHYSSEQFDKILIGILKRQIDLFPDSYRAYEALGWAYYKQDEEELATQNFEKVLELDRNNSFASEMLKKLRK
jgi:tetratricopeptide (TPR) repeat protein